jgi:hypothetical protein
MRDHGSPLPGKVLAYGGDGQYRRQHWDGAVVPHEGCSSGRCARSGILITAVMKEIASNGRQRLVLCHALPDAMEVSGSPAHIHWRLFHLGKFALGATRYSTESI